MQNRISCVKCFVDGELPQERKARLTIWNPHPLQHTDGYISIVKGSEDLLFIPDAYHIGMFLLWILSVISLFPAGILCIPNKEQRRQGHNGSRKNQRRRTPDA